MTQTIFCNVRPKDAKTIMAYFLVNVKSLYYSAIAVPCGAPYGLKCFLYKISFGIRVLMFNLVGFNRLSKAVLNGMIMQG